MGLEDVKEHVEWRRLREITQEELEEKEYWFEGGETEYASNTTETMGYWEDRHNIVLVMASTRQATLRGCVERVPRQKG